VIIIRVSIKIDFAMYICICNGVTETEVRRCVRKGACSLSDLQMELGVACNCGKCAASALAVIREENVAPTGACVPVLGLSVSA
jgi:bacterioferritin-associated ferredoxin